MHGFDAYVQCQDCAVIGISAKAPTEEAAVKAWNRRAAPVTSFNVDAKLDRTLEELKQHYGASSKAEVLRKAVALLKVASENEQPDGSIVMRTAQNKELRVVVR